MRPLQQVVPACKQHRPRIDFALITITGNRTRYLVWRRILEHDATIITRWFPIRTWVPGDPLHILPGILKIWARHFLDSLRFYLPPYPDAAVIHAFETYPIYATLVRLLRLKTVIVCCPDGFTYGTTTSNPTLLQRLTLDRTDLFAPWSNYAAVPLFKHSNRALSARTTVLHPGIELDRWRFRGRHSAGQPFRLLFVGGDLRRKGIDTLLAAYRQGLAGMCELHVATQSGYLDEELKADIVNTPGAHLHLDLLPLSEELQRLYRESDAFVLPTNEDKSSLVSLEAMAIGVPVIITASGGIPDIVLDGKTGFIIPPLDPSAIIEAVERLRANPDYARTISMQARAHIEAHFDAKKNTAQLVEWIKALVDERRSQRGI